MVVTNSSILLILKYCIYSLYIEVYRNKVVFIFVAFKMPPTMILPHNQSLLPWIHERVDKKKRVFVYLSLLFLLVICNVILSLSSSVKKQVLPAPIDVEHHDAVNTLSTTVAVVNITTTTTITNNPPEPSPPPPTPPISVFYNVYVPESSPDRSFEIVEEQLHQFDESDAARLSINNTLIVYYNTIGSNNATERIQELCQDKASLSCRHMEHFNSGFEEVTLQKLYEYCSLPSHENARVIYLHNKGSFHKNRDDWRRHGTLAATHRDCVQPPNDQCNFCAIHVSYIPSVQQHGNMWSAQCSYVKRLLSPLDYQKAMVQVNRQYHALRGQKKMHHESWGVSGPWGFALTRHSNEHWIGSHPSVVPCDLNPFPYETFWKKNFNSTTSSLFQWSMLPRRDLQDRDRAVIGDDPSDRFQAARDDTLGRMQDYFFLPGLLLRWLMLYHQGPPDDLAWSVYELFPDFEFWKNALAMHGTDVLVAVLNLTEPLRPVDLTIA